MESKKERSNKDASWITAFCNWVEARDADTGNPGGKTRIWWVDNGLWFRHAKLDVPVGEETAHRLLAR